MKKHILFICVFFWSVSMLSQIDFQISNFKVSITGTSTLHDWTANVNTVTGSVDLELIDGGLTGLSNLKMKLDAKSISGLKEGMDNNIFKALKTNEHRYITFNLNEVSSLSNVGNKSYLTAKGELTIAGETKVVNLQATGTNNYSNDFIFRGLKKLKMSDFKIEPPAYMFGAIKTDDVITIIYEVTFSNYGFSYR